jgi:hypothetical protein
MFALFYTIILTIVYLMVYRELLTMTMYRNEVQVQAFTNQYLAHQIIEIVI